MCVVALGVCAWLFGGGMHGYSGGHEWLLRGACVVALGGHVWLLGGVHGCSGGHAWLLWGACVVAWGACMVALGGVHGCSQGGHAWFFPGGACVGYDKIRSMSGRYASYWNAFLCMCGFRLIGFFSEIEFSHNIQRWHFCTTSNGNKLQTVAS